MYENSDTAGGDIIVFGYNYNELIESLIDRYYLVTELYAEQIEQEEPEVVEYVEKISEKKNCTKKDVLNFNINVVGVSISCSDIFVGKKGFQELLKHSSVRLTY